MKITLPKVKSVGKSAKKAVSKEDIKKWNIGLAIVYVAQAAALLFLSVNKSFVFNTSYITKDQLASELTGQDVYATALRRVFDLNIVYVLVAALLAAALVHGLLAFVVRKNYEKGLAASTNQIRWIGYSVSGGLLLLAIALVAGVNTINTIFAVLSLVAVSGVFACLMERRNSKQKTVAWKPYYLSLVFGAAAWLTVGMSLIGSRIYGSGPALYACILFWSSVILAGLIALTTRLYFKKKLLKTYNNAERAYSVLGFVFASAVVWQIFVSVLQP